MSGVVVVEGSHGGFRLVGCSPVTMGTWPERLQNAIPATIIKPHTQGTKR